MIVIVDYKMGNLGSIANMLKRVGYSAVITSISSKIKEATKLILPGVGKFDKAMENLQKLDLVTTLRQKVIEEKCPVLGICLGMQILAKKSEEGSLAGLGWVNGEVKRFEFYENVKMKVPHMGWNIVKQKKEHPLFNDMFVGQRFYFVHSYHLVCKNVEDILSTTEYGYQFTSSVAKANIMGVQFHPEKSHKFGMKLLANFVEKT
jgi:imidazole glycerol-phosphate synthase subunit HisH